MHPYSKFGMPTSNNIGDNAPGTIILEKGQGHSDPKLGIWHYAIPSCNQTPNLRFLAQMI